MSTLNILIFGRKNVGKTTVMHNLFGEDFIDQQEAHFVSSTRFRWNINDDVSPPVGVHELGDVISSNWLWTKIAQIQSSTNVDYRATNGRYYQFSILCDSKR